MVQASSLPTPMTMYVSRLFALACAPPNTCCEQYEALLEDCLEDLERYYDDPAALELVCVGLEKLLVGKGTGIVDSEVRVAPASRTGGIY
jgi:hypothetical protein